MRFTKDHEWVDLQGDTATVGITAYAADQLGDVVFVDLPEAGKIGDRWRRPGRRRERQGGVRRLFAPISGEVAEANPDLDRHTRRPSMNRPRSWRLVRQDQGLRPVSRSTP